MRLFRCLIVAFIMVSLAGCATEAGGANGTTGPANGGTAAAGGTADNTTPLQDDTYSQNEILHKAQAFFGATTAGLGKAIEKVFADYGRPNAYILGEEAGGAFFAGLRYGKGTLNRKNLPVEQVYWQGPTVGFDFGGSASKVFTLIYHLKSADQLYQRFPGVSGSLYVVAGLGVNYNQADDVILAPIRTGVGLRYGVNVGYIVFTRKPTLNPF